MSLPAANDAVETSSTASTMYLFMAFNLRASVAQLKAAQDLVVRATVATAGTPAVVGDVVVVQRELEVAIQVPVDPGGEAERALDRRVGIREEREHIVVEANPLHAARDLESAPAAVGAEL